MNVKTARIADVFPPGGKIKATQEDGVEFTLQFEDGCESGLAKEPCGPGDGHE